MSAATTDRSLVRKIVRTLSVAVAAATKIPLGVLVARNAAGNAVNAADAAGLRVLGYSLGMADNSAGSAGDIGVEIEVGTAILLDNDGTNPVTAAHVGERCYVVDNQTVASAPGTHGVVAGIVESVTSAGVYVVPDPFVSAAPVPGLSIDVANASSPNGNAIVTIQSAVPGRQIINVWFAATAFAAPADLGTLTATTGTLLVEHTDDAIAAVVTNADGLAVLSLDTATNGTVHAHAERNGIVVTDSAAITGN
jgi:hypothetical protein